MTTITITDGNDTLLVIEVGAGPDRSNIWTRPSGIDGARRALRALTKIADPDRPKRRRAARAVKAALQDENDFVPLLNAAHELARFDS